MSKRPSKDDAYSVEDPTDWISTPLKGLAGVEAALRCQVCKDFFTTPMITSCGHTFCSICIRKSLSSDGNCPACRASDQEVKLKHNGVVEDAVEAFQRARKGMLEFAIQGGKQVGDSTSAEAVSKKKVKRRLDLVKEEVEPRKRTRSSSGRASQQAEQTEVIDCDDNHGDGEGQGSSDGGYEPPEATSVEDDLATCPICQGRMTELQIDRHIDNCTGIPPPCTRLLQGPLKRSVSKAGLVSSKPVKIPERLPQINYGMIKDTVLRKKLGEHGLSIAGSRTVMEKRYTEWLILVNANCDAKNPRSKKELMKDIETWERTLGSRAPMVNGSGNQIKDKDFDSAAWNAKHSDTYHDLVTRAKRKFVRPTTPTSKNEKVGSTCSVPEIEEERSRIPAPNLSDNRPLSSRDKTASACTSDRSAEGSPADRLELMNTIPTNNTLPVPPFSQRNLENSYKESTARNVEQPL